jgi:hypothetical protein
MFRCNEIITCVNIDARKWGKPYDEKHSWYYKEINKYGDYSSCWDGGNLLYGYPVNRDDITISGIHIGGQYKVLSNYGDFLLLKNDDGIETKYRIERFVSKEQLIKLKINDLCIKAKKNLNQVN